MGVVQGTPITSCHINEMPMLHVIFRKKSTCPLSLLAMLHATLQATISHVMMFRFCVKARDCPCHHFNFRGETQRERGVLSTSGCSERYIYNESKMLYVYAQIGDDNTG